MEHLFLGIVAVALFGLVVALFARRSRGRTILRCSLLLHVVITLVFFAVGAVLSADTYAVVDLVLKFLIGQIVMTLSNLTCLITILDERLTAQKENRIANAAPNSDGHEPVPRR